MLCLVNRAVTLKFSDLLACRFPGPLLKKWLFPPVLVGVPRLLASPVPSMEYTLQANKNPKNPEYLLLYHFGGSSILAGLSSLHLSQSF